MIKFIKNKKKYLIITFIVGGIIFAGQKLLSEDETSTTQQSVVTAQVERGTLTESVSASGQIESANYLGVTTSVNGIVKDVFVSEGDTVYKGQSIMEITLNSDGEESLAGAWASYLSAQNALASAQTSLISTESALINAEEDFQDEKESNSYQSHDERINYELSENAYQVAKENYDNQKSSITQKQVALNKAWLAYQAQSPTIVAPQSGTVANIVVVEGMDITNSLSERTSATVASIRKEGTPIATINISEIDINKVKVGQTVELILNSIENKVFAGKVVGIDKIGTTASGVSNYPVIVKFDESSDQVLPNMGVDVEIILQEKENVVYVPSAAIIAQKGKTIVRTENGDQVQVEVGITASQQTEIISGISEGTTVLIDALPTFGFTDSESTNQRTGSMLPGMSGGRK